MSNASERASRQANGPLLYASTSYNSGPPCPRPKTFGAMGVVDPDYRLEFEETRANAGHQGSGGGSGQLGQALPHSWVE